MQSALNHAPLKRLGLHISNAKEAYRTPLEVFTRHRPVQLLLRAMIISQYPTVVARGELTVGQLIGIASFPHAADSMHRKVLELTCTSYQRRIVAHNEKTSIVKALFVFGHYLLVCQTRPGGHMQQFEWRGPRLVTKTTSRWTCENENLLYGKREVFHARRMLPYCSGLHGTPASHKRIESAASLNRDYQVASYLAGIKDGKEHFREGSIRMPA